MALIRLGPFSEMHFSLLKQKLDQANVTFEKIEDPELLQAKMLKNNKSDIITDPNYSASHVPEYIFIEMEKEFVLIIRQDLNNLGLSPASDGHELEGNDYLCTECNFSSEEPGYCPTHQTMLLSYFDWVNHKKNEKINNGSPGRSVFRYWVNIFWIVLVVAEIIAEIAKWVSNK